MSPQFTNCTITPTEICKDCTPETGEEGFARFHLVNWRNKWRYVYQNYYEQILLSIIWIGPQDPEVIVIVKKNNLEYGEKDTPKYDEENDVTSLSHGTIVDKVVYVAEEEY